MADHQRRTVRRAAVARARSARTSRGKTPPPASASQPASIQLVSLPVSSTITVRADSQTSGRQSGSTRSAACGGVLPRPPVARVRTAPRAEPSPARPIGQEPAGPANSCERRDAGGRGETASAGPSPEQVTDLLPRYTCPGAAVSRAVEQFAGPAGFWPRSADRTKQY